VGFKAVDGIVYAIRAEILGGKLAQGERLPNEKDFARQFGVSQPTVREAIRVLEATGFVRVEHGRGTFVHGGVQQFIARSLETLLEFEAVGIVQAQQVRIALAHLSIGEAAVRATPEDIAEIERRHLAIVELGSVNADDNGVIADAIIAFNIAVSRAAHNPLLLALESFLIRLIVNFMVKAVKETDIENWIDHVRMRIPQREAILKALESRNAEVSIEVMMSHLTSQYEAFMNDAGFNALRLEDLGALRVVSSVASN
jgi:GntR family transcriptional repressor for pyruvate dehydrogenase complex